MLRIDFYVQHLLRQNADGLELVSGTPVKFKFAAGDRQSTQAVEHALIAQAVQEVAPPSAIDELRKTRQCTFVHQGEGGVAIQVKVEILSGQQWQVLLTKATEAKAPPAQEPIVSRFNDSPPISPPSSSGSVSSAGAMSAPASVAKPLAPTVPEASKAQPAVASPAVAPKAEPPKAEAHAEEGERHTALKNAGVSLQEVPGEPKMNMLLRTMIAVKASDLHLSSDVLPMVRQHGEMVALYERPPISPKEMDELLLEILPERNRLEFAERNDTDFAHAIEGLARFRMNYFRDRKGMGAVARQIPFEIVSPEKLGIPPKVLDLCYLSKGLVLVTGPTGSGKSTTLATLIDVINQKRFDHIITIEDPIEFVHPNKNCLVNQREIAVHTAGFKSALRAALREDPDIVLVGEMRDLETIAIAIETAETGHLVFGTLHTTSAMSTVDRIIDQFPSERQSQIRVMLSESLRGVVSQMLCKKKGGGRVAAYEVLIANNAVSNLIREGKTFQIASIMQTNKQLGMQLMNDHLMSLVQSNQVDPVEAFMKSNDKAQFREALKKNGIELNLP